MSDVVLITLFICITFFLSFSIYFVSKDICISDNNFYSYLKQLNRKDLLKLKALIEKVLSDL